MKGRLIVIEGLEGAGKSTAIKGMMEFLTHHHIPCIQTREPGGTQIGEQLRSLIKTPLKGECLSSRAELLLLYAARVQLIEQLILPALEAGTWVIADRFELSTYAYQGGGRQLDLRMIDQLSAFCVQGLEADWTFFLDIAPAAGLERAKKRGKADRIEQETVDFFKRVYDAYHARIALMTRVSCFDATLPVADIKEHITQVLMRLHREA